MAIKKILPETKTTVIRGCGVQGCCPTIEYKDDQVFVKDDFNNVAKMSKKQWKELLVAVINHENKK